MRLLIFGFGFSAKALASRAAQRGWSVDATARRPEDRAAAEALGVQAIDPADSAALAAAAAGAEAVLVTAPPGPDGCPGFAALGARLSAAAPPIWIGYLSTTGVYGDRDGRWVFETSPLKPQSPEAERRVRAEAQWLGLGQQPGPTVTIFRLPGIYGPGRSPLDRVRAGTAVRILKPGHVFSRIHVDDLAEAVIASITRPRAGAIYNLCDDQPASSSEVTAYAARLLHAPSPPIEPWDEQTASAAQRRFYGECKRVSNAQAKAALGWRPAYPTYREGLKATLAVETSRS